MCYQKLFEVGKKESACISVNQRLRNLCGYCVFCDKPLRRLARHYGFTAEELDFILNYDTRLRQGFGGQVQYRLGRDAESEAD